MALRPCSSPVHPVPDEAYPHVLCYDCIRKYVEGLTKGEVYCFKNSSGALEQLPCPIFGCDQYMDSAAISNSYTFQENWQLLLAAKTRFHNPPQ